MSDISSPAVTIQGKNVKIAGAGFAYEVEMLDGENVAQALDRIGVDASGLGVDLLLGDQRHDAANVTTDQVTDGQTIPAPPKQAALGSC